LKAKEVDELIEKLKQTDEDLAICLEPDSLVEFCEDIASEPKKMFQYKGVTIKLLQRF
jgi:hypothetical protein